MDRASAAGLSVLDGERQRKNPAVPPSDGCRRMKYSSAVPCSQPYPHHSAPPYSAGDLSSTIPARGKIPGEQWPPCVLAAWAQLLPCPSTAGRCPFDDRTRFNAVNHESYPTATPIQCRGIRNGFHAVVGKSLEDRRYAAIVRWGKRSRRFCPLVHATSSAYFVIADLPAIRAEVQRRQQHSDLALPHVGQKKPHSDRLPVHGLFLQCARSSESVPLCICGTPGRASYMEAAGERRDRICPKGIGPSQIPNVHSFAF